MVAACTVGAIFLFSIDKIYNLHNLHNLHSLHNLTLSVWVGRRFRVGAVFERHVGGRQRVHDACWEQRV